MKDVKKFLTLIAAGILTVTGMIGCSKKLSPESGSSNDTENSYIAVDGSLDSVLQSTDYKRADQAGRKQLVLQALQSPDCEQYIQSDSVIAEDADYVSFHYQNGAECIVDLTDGPEYGTLSRMPSYSDFWVRGESNGLPTSAFKIERFPWQISEMESPYSEGDKKALLIDALGFSDVSCNLEENAKEWSKCHLQTTYAKSFTVKDFMTKLAEYDYVNISCHGCMADNKPHIQTDEAISVQKYIAYNPDLSAGRVAMFYSLCTKSFIINPGFFQHHYKGGKLDHTIIWLSCCHGLENEKLADDFMAAGTIFLIGADGINQTYYDEILQINFMYEMFTGKEAFEALNIAKEKNQSVREKYMNGVSIKPYTTARVYLFTLTDEAKKKWQRASSTEVSPVSGYVTDADGNPVAGAQVYPQHRVSGNWSNANHAVTDENGRFSFELKDDTYRILVKADGYPDKTTEEYEISATKDSEGNRFEFVIGTIKLEKIREPAQTYYNYFGSIVENAAFNIIDEYSGSTYQADLIWYDLADIDRDQEKELIVEYDVPGAGEVGRYLVIYKVEGVIISETEPISLYHCNALYYAADGNGLIYNCYSPGGYWFGRIRLPYHKCEEIESCSEDSGDYDAYQRSLEHYAGALIQSYSVSDTSLLNEKAPSSFSQW